MPVEIYAADQPGTLAVDCRQIMTADDARYILERCRSAVRSRPVHFLIDCSELHTLAPGVLAVIAGYSDFLHHPNTRWLAVVTRSALLRRSIQLLFAPADLRFFEDRDSARQFLHSVGE
jgi:hypothetical protein